MTQLLFWRTDLKFVSCNYMVLKDSGRPANISMLPYNSTSPKYSLNYWREVAGWAEATGKISCLWRRRLCRSICKRSIAVVSAADWTNNPQDKASTGLVLPASPVPYLLQCASRTTFSILWIISTMSIFPLSFQASSKTDPVNCKNTVSVKWRIQ